MKGSDLVHDCSGGGFRPRDRR